MTDMATTTTAKGQQFENYVASLYEALGFKVERNVNIKGQQIDLLIRRSIPGFGLIQSVVECKFLTSGNVSNQVIHDFGNYIGRAREHAGLHSGIIVTNRDFSTNAKLSAQQENFVHLKRQTDLENELFDITDILHYRIREYENKE